MNDIEKKAKLIVNTLQDEKLGSNMEEYCTPDPTKNLEVGINRGTNQVVLKFKDEILTFDNVAIIKDFIAKLKIAIKIVEMLAPNLN